MKLFNRKGRKGCFDAVGTVGTVGAVGVETHCNASLRHSHD